jgi:hypothetical protein
MVNLRLARVLGEFDGAAAVSVETRTKITVPEGQKLLNSALGVIVNQLM